MSARYDSVAVGLHWLIAALILSNLLLGGWMAEAIAIEADQALAIEAFQLHKSLGLTVLALSLLRLAWRLSHRAPPLPATMPAWQQRAAGVSHALLYALMILLPFSGWLTVSTQWRGEGPLQLPTLWFGLFEVPHLFGLADGPAEQRQQMAELGLLLHRGLGWAMSLLLLAHIGAALRHRFWLRDTVMQRMVPARRGGAFVVIAIISALPLGIWLALGDTQPGAADGDELLERPWPAATATAWQALPAQSRLEFSGEHAGQPFRGSFSRWAAALYFDPDDLAASQLHARILTASASDGVPLHDRTLREAEWFDVARHPLATYRSVEIEPAPEGQYRARGELTIKGHRVAVPILTLRPEGDTLHLRGAFVLDRAQIDLGMASDPDGEYVSREITVEVNVRAVRR